MTFRIYRAPRSKKNGARIVTRPHPRLLPSKAWVEWLDNCRFDGPEPNTIPLWRGGVCNCMALFYVDSMRHVDANNLYSGLADLLQHHGVVDDDKCIIAWDGSRVYLDRKNPRTVVTLTEMEPTLVDDKPKRRSPKRPLG